MKNIFKHLILVIVVQTSIAQNNRFDIDNHFKDIQFSDLMILGSFHFNNPGLDEYKPEYEVDIMSDLRQKELMKIIDAIKTYAPTKIAVEWRKNRQKRLDSLYNEYLVGNFELRRNEVYQIGFRVAKLLGHKKVYAVDAPAKRNNDIISEEYSKKETYYRQKADQSLLQRELQIHQTFTKMYAIGDKMKTEIPLIDSFLHMNAPKTIKIMHGHYLIGNFKMGEGNDYFGPDNAMWWYNRNLRIFHNLLQINNPGKDRIFLLIGAGHLSILDFLADTSIDFNKKRFEEYVKD
ncbi:hypothetical protein D7030_09840 [Flavobacteriaceae bacterium AU392]|nr:hypothetical protein D1817_06970 [Flavobacteriaceae bacterium]RKM83588.1 hypothetical protein D7030_09840 [Flavobacteriaceae bacterium AU392]